MDTLTTVADREVRAAAPAGSPFAPRNMRLLWMKPTRFFTIGLDLGAPKHFIPAILLAGISQATGRIDKELMRADLGRPGPGWEIWGPVVTESWLNFWLFALAVGALAAGFIWYVGGWWYRVRIKWSGDERPDKKLARLVYSYSLLVSVVPALLLLVAQTLLYDNYLAVWNSDEVASAILLIFPFWSCVTSYRGVRARFDVRAGRARLWFLVLPMFVYAFVFGVVGVLYALLG